MRFGHPWNKQMRPPITSPQDGEIRYLAVENQKPAQLWATAPKRSEPRERAVFLLNSGECNLVVRGHTLPFGLHWNNHKEEASL